MVAAAAVAGGRVAVAQPEGVGGEPDLVVGVGGGGWGEAHCIPCVVVESLEFAGWDWGIWF